MHRRCTGSRRILRLIAPDFVINYSSFEQAVYEIFNGLVVGKTVKGAIIVEGIDRRAFAAILHEILVLAFVGDSAGGVISGDIAVG